MPGWPRSEGAGLVHQAGVRVLGPDRFVMFAPCHAFAARLHCFVVPPHVRFITCYWDPKTNFFRMDFSLLDVACCDALWRRHAWRLSGNFRFALQWKAPAAHHCRHFLRLADAGSCLVALICAAHTCAVNRSC